MSGFDPDWLHLREAADHRARNPDVLQAVAAHFAGRDTMRVLDIGCGSGSNVRALSPRLPTSQHWDLADHDADLLQAAQDAARHGVARVCVRTHHIDLAAEVTDALDLRPDLVTAAAFFDLVSSEWISGFVAALKQRGLPLYAVLSYDGDEQWLPPHPFDAAMLSAFHAHQSRDKGFGAAAGPEAHVLLAQALGQAGYRVVEGESPWRLAAAEDAVLIAALASGAAQAVGETGLIPDPALADWRAARTHAQACTIGHRDLFAYL